MTCRLGTGCSVKNAFKMDSKSCASQGNLCAIVLKFNMLAQYLNMVGMLFTNHTETYGLDCFQAAARHQCFASMANSPYKCKNIYRGTFPEANVQKTCKAIGDGSFSFGLVACRDISPFTEILVYYGASYLYPTHYDD